MAAYGRLVLVLLAGLAAGTFGQCLFTPPCPISPLFAYYVNSLGCCTACSAGYSCPDNTNRVPCDTTIDQFQGGTGAHACGQARVCNATTQYETRAVTPTSNRECGSLTVCTIVEVEYVPPTPTSNRQCTCRTGFYGSSPTCTPCISTLTACSSCILVGSDLSCLKCWPGYTLISSICALTSTSSTSTTTTSSTSSTTVSPSTTTTSSTTTTPSTSSTTVSPSTTTTSSTSSTTVSPSTTTTSSTSDASSTTSDVESAVPSIDVVSQRDTLSGLSNPAVYGIVGTCIFILCAVCVILFRRHHRRKARPTGLRKGLQGPAHAMLNPNYRPPPYPRESNQLYESIDDEHYLVPTRTIYSQPRFAPVVGSLPTASSVPVYAIATPSRLPTGTTTNTHTIPAQARLSASVSPTPMGSATQLIEPLYDLGTMPSVEESVQIPTLPPAPYIEVPADASDVIYDMGTVDASDVIYDLGTVDGPADQTVDTGYIDVAGQETTSG